MTPATSSWVLAPAKVNLRLEVLGRRDDGYHELRTWILAVDLCDRLRLRSSPGSGVCAEVSGPQASDDIPVDGGNIAVRAVELALASLEKTGAKGSALLADGSGLVLELEKHIPSQAGLGGASSDAAAALFALESFLGQDLGSERRCEILASLGSDCVFFDRARTTGLGFCSGRGERVEELQALPEDWRVVVATPALRCPTGEVYRAWARSGSVASEQGQSARLSRSRGDSMTGVLQGKRLSELRTLIENDLEPAARRAVPELDTWLGALHEDIASLASAPIESSLFTLSGSGSSVFSIHENEESALAALARVRKTSREQETPLRGSWILKPAAFDPLRIPETN